jgi:hypothetical protein
MLWATQGTNLIAEKQSSTFKSFISPEPIRAFGFRGTASASYGLLGSNKTNHRFLDNNISEKQAASICRFDLYVPFKYRNSPPRIWTHTEYINQLRAVFLMWFSRHEYPNAFRQWLLAIFREHTLLFTKTWLLKCQCYGLCHNETFNNVCVLPEDGRWIQPKRVRVRRANHVRKVLLVG